jgi:hypothetical protein
MRTTRNVGAVLVCVAMTAITVIVAGCASNPTAGFSSDSEPKVIAIRNSSGRAAQSILVGEDREPADRPRRVGGVAPVAINHTYAFRRAPGAPRLPATVRVTYSFPRGPEQKTVIDLRPLAKQAHGGADEAVVFELRADGSVTAYIDRVAP